MKMTIGKAAMQMAALVKTRPYHLMISSLRSRQARGRISKIKNFNYGHLPVKTRCVDIQSLISCRVKALIVRAACWGILPIVMAEWLIKCLHLENDQ